VLLQVRREIIGYQRVPARGDCTTYAYFNSDPGSIIGILSSLVLADQHVELI
jgi:hypothetical protein